MRIAEKIPIVGVERPTKLFLSAAKKKLFLERKMCFILVNGFFDENFCTRKRCLADQKNVSIEQGGPDQTKSSGPVLHSRYKGVSRPGGSRYRHKVDLIPAAAKEQREFLPKTLVF